MKYYLGNWQWKTQKGDSFYDKPAEAIGAIDLGTLPEMGVAGVPRKGCLCWTDGANLGSEYDLLGSGHISEIARSAMLSAILAKTIGAVPDGDHLHEMVLDCLIGKSDPDGNTAPVPIVPDIDGWMYLTLQGHGRVKGARFEWGVTDGHTKKLRRMLRNEFAKLKADAESGKLKDSVHHRRVLDDWCRKYKVDEWREFVPDALQKDVPGRIDRETSYSDDFNGADADPIGSPWSVIQGTYTIQSNQASPKADARARARYDGDLSSADHYSQCIFGASTTGASSGLGVFARKDSSATLTYYGWAATSSTATVLRKYIADAATNLGSGSITVVAGTTAMRIDCNGSSIVGKINGTSSISSTDTAITSNLRCGIQAFNNADVNDDFICADLSAGGGIIFTQTERGTRGLERGMYTRFN